jgi:hypothetical protein
MQDLSRFEPETEVERQLQRKLLALGGSRVAPGPDSYLDAVVKRGQVATGEVALIAGEPSRCYANVAAMWYATGALMRIATGYALGDDGTWHPHAWGLGKGCVIETTERQHTYFGVVLDNVMPEDLEAARQAAIGFCIAHWWGQQPSPAYPLLPPWLSDRRAELASLLGVKLAELPLPPRPPLPAGPLPRPW